MRRWETALICVAAIAGLCLPTPALSGAAVSESGIVVAQAGSNVKSFKKAKNRDGGETCSVQCKDGTSAKQTCTAKKPTCYCSCSTFAYCRCEN